MGRNRSDIRSELHCDFPAREAFRESLLLRLMVLSDELGAPTKPQPHDLEPALLEDGEMEAISAAGDATKPSDESRQTW